MLYLLHFISGICENNVGLVLKILRQQIHPWDYSQTKYRETSKTAVDI